MFKASAILSILCLLSLPASAQVFAAVDETPPTPECSIAHHEPFEVRDCYIPQHDPDPAMLPAKFGFADNNPDFSITISVTQPTQVVVEYLQVYFLSTQHGPFPAYVIAIGVVIGNSTQMQLCGPQIGTPLDSPGSIGLPAFSKCTITIPPGQATFYALEGARTGGSAFKGCKNQSFTVSAPGAVQIAPPKSLCPTS